MRWPVIAGMLLLLLPAAAGAQAAPPAPAARAQALVDRLADELWELADEHWHAGRYEDRIALDYLVLELDPTFYEPYSTASWLIDSNGRAAEAEALLRRGTVAFPEFWQAWDELGSFLFGKKRYEEAAPAYEKAVARPDCHPKVIHMLAHAYRRAGDLQKSLATWKEAQRRAPGDMVVERNLKQVQELLERRP